MTDPLAEAPSIEEVLGACQERLAAVRLARREYMRQYKASRKNGSQKP